MGRRLRESGPRRREHRAHEVAVADRLPEPPFLDLIRLTRQHGGEAEARSSAPTGVLHLGPGEPLALEHAEVVAERVHVETHAEGELGEPDSRSVHQGGENPQPAALHESAISVGRTWHVTHYPLSGARRADFHGHPSPGVRTARAGGSGNRWRALRLHRRGRDDGGAARGVPRGHGARGAAVARVLTDDRRLGRVGRSGFQQSTRAVPSGRERLRERPHADGDDRAFIEEHERLGEPVRVVEPGLTAELSEDREQPLLLATSLGEHQRGVPGAVDLGARVDGAASLGAVARHPGDGGIEDREHAGGPRLRDPCEVSGDVIPPAGVPVLQVRDDERFLRSEAVVQGLLRHPGRSGDGVDSDSVDAALVEEVGGGIEHAARPGGQRRELRHGGRHAMNRYTLPGHDRGCSGGLRPYVELGLPHPRGRHRGRRPADAPGVAVHAARRPARGPCRGVRSGEGDDRAGARCPSGHRSARPVRVLRCCVRSRRRRDRHRHRRADRRRPAAARRRAGRAGAGPPCARCPGGGTGDRGGGGAARRAVAVRCRLRAACRLPASGGGDGLPRDRHAGAAADGRAYGGAADPDHPRERDRRAAPRHRRARRGTRAAGATVVLDRRGPDRRLPHARRLWPVLVAAAPGRHHRTAGAALPRRPGDRDRRGAAARRTPHGDHARRVRAVRRRGDRGARERGAEPGRGGGGRLRDAGSGPDADRPALEGHHIAVAELTPAAPVHLAVHGDVAVDDDLLRVAARVQQSRELEELAEADDLAADGDLVDRIGVRHLCMLALWAAVTRRRRCRRPRTRRRRRCRSSGCPS
ncbi:unnamed protein product [Penicillium discolor]